MKFKQTLAAVAVAAVASMASVPASAAADYSLLFQGVTFEIAVIDSDSLTLTMLGTDSATGGWAGAATLANFLVGDSSLGSFTSGTATGPGNFTSNSSQLSANGCATGNSDGLCFTGSTAVAPSLSWTIDAVGDTWHIGSMGPHLKVRFLDANGGKVGSLLSTEIPPVPEPETYALMLAGLGAIGFVARRRKSA